MLRILSFAIKLAVLSLIILVLGNWIRWEGKTVSDQVKVRMSHAERSILPSWEWSWRRFENWAKRLIRGSVTHEDRKPGKQTGSPVLSVSEVSDEVDAESEVIQSSERQKLKALIRDLNNSQRHN